MPSGGWSIAFADAFAVPLVEDPTWVQSESNDGFNNSNEIEVLRKAQSETGRQGLSLKCTYIGGSGRKYECGAVNTFSSKPFKWLTAAGETWAFECYCEWPKNTGEADPGWWANGYEQGENEYDFFEGFGSGKEGSTEYPNAVMPAIPGVGEQEIFNVTKALGFDPTAEYHRYTTVLRPNGGGGAYVSTEYIDGQLKWSMAYRDRQQSWDGLKISYALRAHTSGFTTGTRTFGIRSVAVYEDGAHAGQGIKGGGVAPGTTIGP